MELHRPEAVRAGAFSHILCLRCEIAHLSGSAFLYLARDKIPPAGTAPAGGTIFSAHSAPDKQTEIRVYLKSTTLCNLHCKICFRHGWIGERLGHMSDECFCAARDQILQIPSVEEVFFGCDTCT